MSKVGIWDGVTAGGASRVEGEDRKAQNANFAAAAQREIVQKAFGLASGPG